ncbi:MAG TPA: glycoside hydrolase family 2 TIM barrel-domain containing protein [Verrucomicrobiae bacterium]|nr:glycoside hydrolase family 2 TIM barrel-domain containing protein [Verrucomicrobiae bacterium]
MKLKRLAQIKRALPLLFVAVIAAFCPAASVREANTAEHGQVLPRLEERFDDDWRFHLGDVPEASVMDLDDSSWRTVNLPHDWSIEDLPPSPAANLPTVNAGRGTWRFKEGDDSSWRAADLDDSSWRDIKLPARWSELGLKAENAFGWYRCHIQVPADLRGKEVLLLLGKVDDVDETFVNGTRVGGMGSFPPAYETAWDRVRRYRVPANLFKCDGTDVIAVRDYNGSADGGIIETAAPLLRSGPFTMDSPNGGPQGYTEGGLAWYRKTFTLPAAEQGRQVGITFEGVYMNSEVWFNGQKLGGRPYGYSSFYFDLTPLARFGKQPNVLSVKVDSRGKTSRWYSGSGIYRHVWLTLTDPVHIGQWGVYITTPRVSKDEAEVSVRTAVNNEGHAPQNVTIESRIVRAAAPNKTLAIVNGHVAMAAAGAQEVQQTVKVPRPHLWSPDNPELYCLISTIKRQGIVLDEVRTTFGIRSVSVDAERGFVLNGEPLKLRGGCLHHDNGCLGSCAYDRAEERKVELLKAAGYNAVRTSHNPPSPALLAACDRLGLLVIDEAFDCWEIGKNSDDYARYFKDWWRRDLGDMVRRDRNHPSVVLWSIGNEIPGQPTPEAAKIGGELAQCVRELDPTRPVTQAAFAGETKNLLLFTNLDVCGYNYMPDHYVPDHAVQPGRVMCGTESFPRDCFAAWMPVVDHPYVIGDFVWTAFDYIGEAGLGHEEHTVYPPGQFEARPFTMANCGDFDLCGFRRAASYYRSAVWGVGSGVSCFVEALGDHGESSRVDGWNWGWYDERPSWTWPGWEGKMVRAHVYSHAPKVRLTLNGRNLGERKTDRATHFLATWEMPYEPGELVAVALAEDGKELDRWALRTAGQPATIRLTPDRARLTANGQDLSFVTVEILDQRGVRVPNADSELHFRVSGPGEIIGVGNGDPHSWESFQQPLRRAYRGRCLVVIKTTAKAGKIKLEAAGAGLKEASVLLKTITVQ